MRPPAAPALPASSPSPAPPSPSSGPPSPTTSPSTTSCTTPTAPFPASTSSPRSGPGRKARCCSGPGCSRPTASSFACATRSDITLYAYASTILAGVQIFFLLLVNVVALPFAFAPGGVAPADGFGLNPLLQYPEMVIHPPMLYLGYVGFSVPFAFALGALMMRYPGEKWIHITRRWTMVTWLFLTCGIILGMHWAYAVLGWGGYWGWDPVENASLMPWLTGTAFLHSVMMQEKRGMMKGWNVWLIFVTFMLTILGTLLTRSGLVSSVHAFAESSIGTWFICVPRASSSPSASSPSSINRDHLEEREPPRVPRLARDSASSSTTSSCSPPASPFSGARSSPCSPSSFRAPRSPWARPSTTASPCPSASSCSSSPASARCSPGAPPRCAPSAATSSFPASPSSSPPIVLIIAGVRPWTRTTSAGDVGSSIYALVCFALGAGVITAIVAEFLRGAGVVRTQTGKNLFAPPSCSPAATPAATAATSSTSASSSCSSASPAPPSTSPRKLEMGFGDSMQRGRLQGRLPELLAGLQPQLRHRLRPARRLPQRQDDHPPRPRAPLLLRTPTSPALHRRRHPLHARRTTSTSSSKARNPDNRQAHHQVLPQPAGQLDLDRRRHRDLRHLHRARTAAEARHPPRRSPLTRRPDRTARLAVSPAAAVHR